MYASAACWYFFVSCVVTPVLTHCSTSRPAGSAWGKINTNAWAALAVDEDMEEAAATRSPAATGPASVTESSLVQGSGKVLASSEAVRKASVSLIRVRQLCSSHALARLQQLTVSTLLRGSILYRCPLHLCDFHTH